MIPGHEVAEVHAHAARGLGPTEIAAAMGQHRSWVRRRLAVAPTAKPRLRVPVISGFERPQARPPAPLYSPPPAPEPPSREITRVLAIGDMHDDPHLPKDRFRWIGRMIADLAPDRVVQIGDLCDLDSLSFHSPNDTDSGRYKPRFMADLASLREGLDLMMEPLAAMSAAPRFDVTLGNHENRIWRFENTQPEICGMLQRDFTALLGERGIAWHRYGQYLTIAGVDFTHIPQTKMCKPMSRAAIVRASMRDLVHGHTHSMMVTPIEKANNQRISVVDIGSAMPDGHIGSYARDTATSPWWGVVLLTIRNGRVEGHEAVPMFVLRERYS